MTVSKDSKITVTDMNAVHTSTKQALTKTKRSFTWTKWPVTNTRNINAVDFTEMRNALDLAYDYRTEGGSAGYSTHNTGDDRDYSYLADFGDRSHNSSDNGDYNHKSECTAYWFNYGVNYSAQYHVD